MNNKNIGVFDSGMGGLTVLKALREALPGESFIYLGDTARLPYGTKSVATVKAYAGQMAAILVERQIKTLVIACNTATTAALDYLKQLLPDILVVGVIEPGARAAVKRSKGLNIGVMATETTVASGAYQRQIQAMAMKARVSAKACSLLVALAEEGMHANAIAHQVLRHYLNGLSSIDCLLLGCTHFPVFEPALAELLPKGVEVVDSAVETAMAVKTALEDRGLLRQLQPASTQFLVTDSIERFRQIGAHFLGEALNAYSIELV